MADQHEAIDLRTLEEVHRLLASSDFATADDRLRVGLVPADPSGALTGQPLESPPAAPLPRRR